MSSCALPNSFCRSTASIVSRALSCTLPFCLSGPWHDTQYLFSTCVARSAKAVSFSSVLEAAPFTGPVCATSCTKQMDHRATMPLRPAAQLVHFIPAIAKSCFLIANTCSESQPGYTISPGDAESHLVLSIRLLANNNVDDADHQQRVLQRQKTTRPTTGDSCRRLRGLISGRGFDSPRLHHFRVSQPISNQNRLVR